MSQPGRDDALAETSFDPREPARGQPPRLTEPAPGATIGRFLVTGLLGRGGMGVVVSAHDPELDREVAIKLVRPTGLDEEAAQLRAGLLREARAMAKVRHPNVVSVYEAGEHEGQVYVAMERVEGGTLREALAVLGAARDWRRVIALFADAAQGLAAAHAAGLVHRDFKPDNVLIDRDGRALVGDFGLVLGAETDLARAPSGPTLDGTALTRADAILGSPAYMAPEQWRGDVVDARSDQFAFCVSLYEALYGALPFSGSNPADYRAAVLAGALVAPSKASGVPDWLRQVVLRGLAHAPEQRFASMERLMSELGVDWRHPRRRGRRERSLLLAALVAYGFAWAIATVALGVGPSYAMHYWSQTTFLGLALIFGVLAWPAIGMSAFNRMTFALVVLIGVAPLVVAVGGQLMGASATEVEVFNLATFGIVYLFASLTLDRFMAAGTAVYLAGFLLAAARSELVFVAVPATHITAGVVALIAFQRRGRIFGLSNRVGLVRGIRES